MGRIQIIILFSSVFTVILKFIYDFIVFSGFLLFVGLCKHVSFCCHCLFWLNLIQKQHRFVFLLFFNFPDICLRIFKIVFCWFVQFIHRMKFTVTLIIWEISWIFKFFACIHIWTVLNGAKFNWIISFFFLFLKISNWNSMKLAC